MIGICPQCGNYERNKQISENKNILYVSNVGINGNK